MAKRSASQGFTIVEVMVAAAILVVGFMGMIQAITIGSEMMATARRQTLANQILTHEVEKLRLKDWNYIGTTLTSSSLATYSCDLSDLQTAIDGSGVVFQMATTVATPATDLREITFTVQWTRGGTTTAATTPTGSWLNQLSFYRPSVIARTYTRKMSAYFSKYGLSINSQR